MTDDDLLKAECVRAAIALMQLDKYQYNSPATRAGQCAAQIYKTFNKEIGETE